MSWDWAGVSSIRIMGNARRMIAKPTVYRAFFFTKLDDGEYKSTGAAILELRDLQAPPSAF